MYYLKPGRRADFYSCRSPRSCRWKPFTMFGRTICYYFWSRV